MQHIPISANASGKTAAAPIKRQPWWRRLAWRAGQFLLVLYVSIVIVFYTLQTKLIFPGAATQGTPEAQVSVPPGATLVTLQSAQGDRVMALFGAAQNEAGRPIARPREAPTILFFYGNGTCLAYCMDEFSTFRRLGANVMIPDYPGYGLSGGSPGEQGCYAAANAAWQWLEHSPEVNSKKIIVIGSSLGAAVAIDLAAREPAAGLATFSAFTSMVDQAKHLYAFLPVSLMLKHRFNSIEKMGRVSCPIVIGHGVKDELVPYAMSDVLAAAAKVPVTRVRVEDAGHNDFLTTGDDQVQTALRGLMDKVEKSPMP